MKKLISYEACLNVCFYTSTAFAILSSWDCNIFIKAIMIGFMSHLTVLFVYNQLRHWVRMERMEADARSMDRMMEMQGMGSVKK